MALQLKATKEKREIIFSQEQELLISADITAPKSTTSNEQAAIDFVAVIDKSGSMSGSPFNLVKQSLRFVVDNLKQSDQFSIVTFGSTATVDLQLTRMTAQGKDIAHKVIEKLYVDGCTALSDGLLMGIDQLKSRSVKNTTSVILLLTDGVANRGITQTNELVQKMNNSLNRIAGSVSVFTFGFGAEHSAQMLTAISDAARGMYYFIEKADSISLAFAECLGGVLSTVATDIRVTLRIPKPISVKDIMTKYPTKSISKNVWKIDLENIYAEEQRNIPITLQIPKLTYATMDYEVALFELDYVSTMDHKKYHLEQVVRISRPSEATSNVKLVNAENSIALDEQRNRMLAAEALDQATRLGVNGQQSQAKKFLQNALNKIEASLSHNTPYCQSLVRDLKEAVSKMDSSDFNHVASKYLYSLSRAHFNQRSSGISLSGAAAYLTSSKMNMMGIDDNPSKKITQRNSGVSEPKTLENGNETKSNVVNSKKEKTRVVDLSHKDLTVNGARNSKPQVSQEILAKAIRRLMLDFQEIQKESLDTVVARPLESDIFEWHCNMRGPVGSAYNGIVFHLIFIFPQTYPVDPPKLFNCSFISHDHVYGSYICLDLLEEAQFATSEETAKPYTGWSSAYSVQSILLQLQAFLFDKANKDPTAVKKAQESADLFHCESCGHDTLNIYPPFPEKKQTTKEAEVKEVVINKSIVPRMVRVPKGRTLVPKRKRRNNNNINSTSSNNSNGAVPVPVRPATKDCWKHPPQSIYTPKNAPPTSSTATTAAANHIANTPANTTTAATATNTTTVATSVTTTALVQSGVKSSVPVPVPVATGDDTASERPMSSMKEYNGAWKNPPKAIYEKPKTEWERWVALREKRAGSRQPVWNDKNKAAVSKQPVVASPASATQPVQLQQKVEVSTKQEVKESQPKKEEPIKKEISEKKVVAREVYSIEDELKEAIAKYGKKLTGMETSYFSFLVDEIIVDIFSYFKPTDSTIIRKLIIRDLELGPLSRVCKEWLRLTGDKMLWRSLFAQYYPGTIFEARSVQGWKHIFANEQSSVLNGLVCFHTKASFKDTVLGIPINTSTNPRTGNIDKISSTLDLISVEAFEEDGIRRSVWKVPFTNWLPLYINEEHGKRAFPYLVRAMTDILKLREKDFSPDLALQIFPRLMNTMVVSLMSGNLHASHVALEGYCAFHRHLLYFVKKYPELQAKVNKIALDFCAKESNRTKDVVPSLGEFLPILTVSDAISWKQVCMPYLLENFDRNALWTLKKYPWLSRMESTPVSKDRLLKTFDATQVSIRLLMFHVYFFKNVARPEGLSLDEVAANYDAFYGRPSTQMKEALQKKCKEILNIQTWEEFFKGIGLTPPSDEYLTKWLRQSVKNSLAKGYHSAKQFR